MHFLVELPHGTVYNLANNDGLAGNDPPRENKSGAAALATERDNP
jgi:hypothetical protein